MSRGSGEQTTWDGIKCWKVWAQGVGSGWAGEMLKRISVLLCVIVRRSLYGSDGNRSKASPCRSRQCADTRHGPCRHHALWRDVLDSAHRVCHSKWRTRQGQTRARRGQSRCECFTFPHAVCERTFACAFPEFLLRVLTRLCLCGVHRCLGSTAVCRAVQLGGHCDIPEHSTRQADRCGQREHCPFARAWVPWLASQMALSHEFDDLSLAAVLVLQGTCTGICWRRRQSAQWAWPCWHSRLQTTQYWHCLR